jgi:drug/metabolite transporter (DMT)-like permease
MSGRKFDIQATVAVIAGLVLWTAGPIVIRYLAGFIDLWTQNMLRYLAACLFWLPFLLFVIRDGRFERRVFQAALIPAIANIVMQSLWAGAFYYIEPAFMNLLAKSSVIWIAGFSMLFFAEERGLLRSGRFWLGIALSVLGVIGVLVFEEGFAANRTLTGVVLVFLWSLSWAVYTVTVKIAFKDVDSRVGFSVVSFYTVLGLCVLGFVFGQPSRCLEMPKILWLYIVVSGILCIAIGHVLYYFSIKRIGATIPALVLLASPFTVLAVSHFVFAEILSLVQILFGLVLLAGAGVSIWAQKDLGK